MNRQYGINLRDGRVVLCTRETLANIDYYAISERVAVAIENGTLDRMDVVAKVKGKLMTNESEWDALLSRKTSQNMRHSEINVDTTDRSETAISKDEVNGEFDMSVGDAESPKPVKKSANAAYAKKIPTSFDDLSEL